MGVDLYNEGKDFLSPVDQVLVEFIWSSDRGGDAGHVVDWKGVACTLKGVCAELSCAWTGRARWGRMTDGASCERLAVCESTNNHV